MVDENKKSFDKDSLYMEKFENIEEDIRDIKRHNEKRDVEIKSLDKYMSKISEAIVEIRIITQQTNELLMMNNKKLQETETKIEDTNKKFDNFKNRVYQKELNRRFDWDKMMRERVIPFLLFVGLVGFIGLVVSNYFF